MTLDLGDVRTLFHARNHATLADSINITRRHLNTILECEVSRCHDNNNEGRDINNKGHDIEGNEIDDDKDIDTNESSSSEELRVASHLLSYSGQTNNEILRSQLHSHTDEAATMALSQLYSEPVAIAMLCSQLCCERTVTMSPCSQLCCERTVTMPPCSQFGLEQLLQCSEANLDDGSDDDSIGMPSFDELNSIISTVPQTQALNTLTEGQDSVAVPLNTLTEGQVDVPELYIPAVLTERRSNTVLSSTEVTEASFVVSAELNERQNAAVLERQVCGTETEMDTDPLSQFHSIRQCVSEEFVGYQTDYYTQSIPSRRRRGQMHYGSRVELRRCAKQWTDWRTYLKLGVKKNPLPVQGIILRDAERVIFLAKCLTVLMTVGSMLIGLLLQHL